MIALAATTEIRAESTGEPVIAFLSDRDNPAPADEGLFGGLRRLDLYVMQADGSNIRRLTRNVVPDLAPSCSPSGQEVAFSRYRHGNADIWTMRMADRGLTRLTSSPANEGTSSWSPDGSRIVFARTSRRGGDLFTMNAGGNNQQLLVGGPSDDQWPAWSPAGDRIAFLRGRNASDIDPELYVMDTDGSALRKVAADVDNDQLAWSPDGRQLALTRTRGGFSGIWILDIERGQLQRLSLGAFESPPSSPAWSPDGATIAFATGFAIKAVPITGGRAVELTDTKPFEVENWSPTWCPGAPPAR